VSTGSSFAICEQLLPVHNSALQRLEHPEKGVERYVEA
jgi:hypothetical protein